MIETNLEMFKMSKAQMNKVSGGWEPNAVCSLQDANGVITQVEIFTSIDSEARLMAYVDRTNDGLRVIECHFI